MPTDIQNIYEWEFWRLLRIGAVQVRVRQSNQRNHHQKEMVVVYLGDGLVGKRKRRERSTLIPKHGGH